MPQPININNVPMNYFLHGVDAAREAQNAQAPGGAGVQPADNGVAARRLRRRQASHGAAHHGGEGRHRCGGLHARERGVSPRFPARRSTRWKLPSPPARPSPTRSRLCGNVHPKQLSSVYYALSQSGVCGNINGGFLSHGISSNEHMAVTFTL